MTGTQSLGHQLISEGISSDTLNTSGENSDSALMDSLKNKDKKKKVFDAGHL